MITQQSCDKRTKCVTSLVNLAATCTRGQQCHYSTHWASTTSVAYRCSKRLQVLCDGWPSVLSAASTGANINECNYTCTEQEMVECTEVPLITHARMHAHTHTRWSPHQLFGPDWYDIRRRLHPKAPELSQLVLRSPRRSSANHTLPHFTATE